MGHVKEPEGVDLTVDPTPLTEEERLRITELIAYYNRTGRKKQLKDFTQIAQMSKGRKSKTARSSK